MVMARWTCGHELHLTSWPPTIPRRLSPNSYPTRLSHIGLECASENRVDNDIKSMVTTSEGREQELSTVARQSQLNRGKRVMLDIAITAGRTHDRNDQTYYDFPDRLQGTVHRRHHTHTQEPTHKEPQCHDQHNAWGRGRWQRRGVAQTGVGVRVVVVGSVRSWTGARRGGRLRCTSRRELVVLAQLDVADNDKAHARRRGGWGQVDVAASVRRGELHRGSAGWGPG